MSTVPSPSPIDREPDLLGQTVVVVGGSAGIGFETARRARGEGAKSAATTRGWEELCERHQERTSRKVRANRKRHVPWLTNTPQEPRLKLYIRTLIATRLFR